jgi:hypothetical protein
MWEKIKKIIAVAILKNDGSISITKIGILVTGVCATVSQIPGIFAVSGVAVPVCVAEYAKYATLISGLITAFRAKWDLEKVKEQLKDAG